MTSRSPRRSRRCTEHDRDTGPLRRTCRRSRQGGHVARRQTRKRGDAAESLGALAEQLGRAVGTTERKASEWLGRRTELVNRLTQIRNRSTQLLAELQGTGMSAVDSVGRVVRRRLQPVAGKARRKSPPARKKVSATTAERRASTWRTAQEAGDTDESFPIRSHEGSRQNTPQEPAAKRLGWREPTCRTSMPM